MIKLRKNLQFEEGRNSNQRRVRIMSALFFHYDSVVAEVKIMNEIGAALKRITVIKVVQTAVELRGLIQFCSCCVTNEKLKLFPSVFLFLFFLV